MTDLLRLSGGFLTLSREVPAIQVPAGCTATLPAGTEVAIVHELGGDFTLRTRRGNIFRIEGKDADALGREAPLGADVAPPSAAPGEVTDDMLEAKLRTCFDPEIPVNIVDLGLVYELVTQPLDDGGVRVHVQMTLTAPGCGMGQVLADDVKKKLESLPGVREAQVEIVFDPPWDPSMMTEAARLQAGLF
jgi:probable FeS assembly SUF system protein SufT